MSSTHRVVGVAFILAVLAAPGAALAQDVLLKIGTSTTETVFSKRIDKATPLIAKSLMGEIGRALLAAKVDATPADVEAIAQAAAAQATQWQHDFVFHKVCDKTTTSGGTAPSGAFLYVLECRDCRPSAC